MSFSSTDEYQKFETLFKQYYSGLVVYASRFTGNTENAEDLVHDLFIHIWEDNRILGTDHIKAYLFTSIRHRCLNYLDHLKIRNEYQEKILQKRTPAAYRNRHRSFTSPSPENIPDEPF